jgi:hypothetical protein
MRAGVQLSIALPRRRARAINEPARPGRFRNLQRPNPTDTDPKVQP